MPSIKVTKKNCFIKLLAKISVGDNGMGSAVNQCQESIKIDSVVYTIRQLGSGTEFRNGTDVKTIDVKTVSVVYKIVQT